MGVLRLRPSAKQIDSLSYAMRVKLRVHSLLRTGLMKAAKALFQQHGLLWLIAHLARFQTLCNFSSCVCSTSFSCLAINNNGCRASTISIATERILCEEWRVQKLTRIGKVQSSNYVRQVRILYFRDSLVAASCARRCVSDEDYSSPAQDVKRANLHELSSE